MFDRGREEVGLAKPVPMTGQERPSAMETVVGLGRLIKRENRDGVPDMWAEAPESIIQDAGEKARSAVPGLDVEARCEDGVDPTVACDFISRSYSLREIIIFGDNVVGSASVVVE